MSTDMTFEASETEKCLSIPIADTLGLEQDESFFVTLQRTDDLDERIQLNAAVVGGIEIVDDDGECDNLTQLLYNTYCRTVSRFMHLVLCFVIKIYTFTYPTSGCCASQGYCVPGQRGCGCGTSMYCCH